MIKAVFLDRDGVINRDDDYVYQIADCIFIDGVFDACLKLQDMGYVPIIITNQAGIGRGLYTEADFHRLMTWMTGEFEHHGITLGGYFFCPHHPEADLLKYRINCDHRKPCPGMLYKAAEEHDIDLSRSIIIGDKLSDVLAGRAAGLGKCFLVRTGKPISDDDILKADATYDTLVGLVNAMTCNVI